MYFRNKFNNEFLYLCNKQEPKGGTVRLDNVNEFWIVDDYGPEQPSTLHVIPLLLYNKITSSNDDDKKVEDYLMICQNKSDTIVTCEYDPNYFSEQTSEKHICDFGITNLTGDLVGILTKEV